MTEEEMIMQISLNKPGEIGADRVSPTQPQPQPQPDTQTTDTLVTPVVSAGSATTPQVSQFFVWAIAISAAIGITSFLCWNFGTKNILSDGLTWIVIVCIGTFVAINYIKGIAGWDWVKNVLMTVIVAAILMFIVQLWWPDATINSILTSKDPIVQAEQLLDEIEANKQRSYTVTTAKAFIASATPGSSVAKIEKARDVIKEWREKDNPTPEPQPTSLPRVIPQSIRGWRINNNGNIVANIKPGESATYAIHLQEEGESTPIIILPCKHRYRFVLDHLQTIIVEENGKTTIVYPNQHFEMGDIYGVDRKIKFTALKGGVSAIFKVQAL